MTERDTKRLVGCHPDLIAKLTAVFAAMQALGFTMMVTDGVRSVEEQVALYAKGRTKPGPIVTKADGIRNRSNHQPAFEGDGLGRAVDCCFRVEGKPTWDARLPWKAYGACGEAVGLAWGGSWQTFHDLPHLELP